MKSLYRFIKSLGIRSFFKKKSTAIVYYVYINPNKDWKQLVLGQMNDMKHTNVLSVADLYIVVSNPSNVKDVAIFFETISYLYEKIEFHTENKFEYWGMLLIWKLAQESRHYQYLVYFHTKGMTHSERERIKIEEILTHYIFHDWKFFIQIFQENSKINKLGLFPAWKVNNQDEIVRGGWVWYNFWWARADYIRILEQPKIDPKHRYYYEEWLSYLKSDNNSKFYDSFSTYSMTMSSYTNKETLDNTENLIKSSEVSISNFE